LSKKSLIKSTGIISAATALSRVLGFVRDIMFASFFGTGIAAQAFVVAFRIPNTLRDLAGEGAMNAAIVPVLSEYRRVKDEKEFALAARVLFNISLAVLSVLTVIGIVFSPLIVRVMAPGFAADPGKLALTVTLNRLMFPYLILIGLTAYSMGVLNAMNHFAAPAFGPAIMNVALIGSFFLCPKYGVMGLAAGVLIGGLLQLLINIPAMYRNGVHINLKDGFRNPAVKRIGRLLLPRTLGTAVYQINIFVDTILASLAWIVGSGGVAALYYANRLIQFPLGIFGIALAQAALPKMSQEYAANDIGRFKDTLSFSLRAIFLVMLPASFGLAILGRPIIKLLFQRGEFTAYSTGITESALFFYAFGLIAYGGIKLLVSAFYSMHDTMTPVKTAFAAVIMNVVLSVLFMFPLKLGGLALATTISATFNFLNLYRLLTRKLGDFGTKVIVDSFLRALLASSVMGIVLKTAMVAFPESGISGLLIAMIAGAGSFVAACYVFEVREIKDSWAWIVKRR
jgi:putative peptidoglycan lipid II flippase